VDHRLAGVGSFDVAFTARDEDAFKDPAVLKALDKIQAEIASLEGVDKALSVVDFLKDMNQAFQDEDPRFRLVPESRDLVAQYLLLYDADDLKDFVNEDYSRARLAVRISEHRSSRQAELLHRVRKIVGGFLPPDVTARVTGRAVQDVNTIEALVYGQIQSLALAVVVIWGVMIAALRSWKLGLLSLLPNLFPIALNFGIMGLFAIPLNTATALIAAVAIGMAVDNTIHFLAIYSKHRSEGLSRKDAVGDVILSKGRAMVSSSIILLIGFGVLIFSHFIPTIHFGLLCAVIMAAALAGDLIFLPSLALYARIGSR
jgi:hypothetical protein